MLKDMWSYIWKIGVCIITWGGVFSSTIGAIALLVKHQGLLL
jgi:hypothetical protein